MVNFTHTPTLMNAIVTKPRKVLAVAWSVEHGIVAALRNGDGRTLTKFNSDNRMDMANLIRISAQRGGVYAA
jgi:hypothetical protein